MQKRMKNHDELLDSGWKDISQGKGDYEHPNPVIPRIVREMFRDFGTPNQTFWEYRDEMLVVEDPTFGTKPVNGKILTKVEYLNFIQATFVVMTTLIKAKNSDYTAGSDDPFANFRQSTDYGVDPLAGLMVRVGDKLQRIKSFTKNGKLEVPDEGVEDAFKDLIGYSLIALGMLHERKQD